MTGRDPTPLPREQFPVADRYRYLDHASVAAPPTVVAHALARDAAAATMLGSAGHRQRNERVEEVRVTCAGLLGVPVDDVSFVHNTTAGLALVANGLGLTLLPEIAVGLETRLGGVRVMRFAEPEPSRTLGLAWRRTSPRKAEFATFGKLLLDAMPQLPRPTDAGPRG